MTHEHYELATIGLLYENDKEFTKLVDAYIDRLVVDSVKDTMHDESSTQSAAL